MPYIIDGHNLIPHVRGLSLQDLDDEIKLVALLNDFCRSQRQKVEVYFDRAAPAHVGEKTVGLVKAIFVHSGSSADSAIRKRLKDLGKRARSWKVVTSDRQVQAEARAAGAEVIAAADFSRLMLIPASQVRKNSAGAEKPQDETDVEEWLKIFAKKK